MADLPLETDLPLEDSGGPVKVRDLARALVPQVISAGNNAPQYVVQWAVRHISPNVEKEVAAQRAREDFDAETYIDRAIKAQLMLVRGQGLLAGLAISLSELSVIGDGPYAAPLTASAVIGDITTLAYFQVQLSLKIAGAYGFDLSDHESRAREILHLGGFSLALGDNLGPAIANGAERVGKRLILRHLKGPALQAVKSMFRFVGIKFNRTGLLKMLPGVNIPIGIAVADVTTRHSASRARKYYKTLGH